MLDRISSTEWIHKFLLSAGFSESNTIYRSTIPRAWTLHDLKATVFTPTQSEVVRLPIFQGEPDECLVTVKLVRPIYDPIDGNNFFDWYIECDNITSSYLLGRKVRIYLVGAGDGNLSDLYVQTIGDNS